MSGPPLAPTVAAITSAGELVDPGLVRRFLAASQVCALLLSMLGVLVLVGWQFDIGLLKSIQPGLGAMAPGTAVALVLAGATLWLLHPKYDQSWLRQAARVLPLLVLVLSGLTLAEYLLDLSIGIDELFFADPDGEVQTSHPGRMSMVTALELQLLCMALLLTSFEPATPQRIARALALAASVMSLVGFLGLLYGKSSLYAIPIYSGLAIHTVAALLLLAAGILVLQPARGFSSMLVSSGAGGQLSRRLLPYAVVIPLALGWLRLQGEQGGLFQAAMGVDLMMVTVTVLLFALIWGNARLLDAASTEQARAEFALRTYADEVQDLYEHAPCGYHSLDAGGVFVRINDTELSWLGYERSEVVGKLKFSDLLTPESGRVFQKSFARFRSQGEIRDIEFDLRRKDGSILPVSVSATAVSDAAGRYVMSRSTVFDITERRRADLALRLSDQQARLRLAEIEQIYRYAPVGLFIFDCEYRFQRINDRMAEINGFPPAAHIGKSMWEIVPDLAEQLTELYRPIYERGEPVLDVEIHGRTPGDPEADHVWLGSYFPLKSDSGQVIGMIGAVLDITQRKRTEQALRESEAAIRALALSDPLTGLANRRRLDEALHTEIDRVQRYGGRLSAVIADLDHFKLVNDKYGHQVGDAVLQEFARIIHSHCRSSDVVARFGGEEFMILMPEVGAAEAQACAERMRETLAATIVAPLTQSTTASFGVAELLPGEAEASLLKRADQALYRGKAAGRNCVVVADSAGQATPTSAG